MPAGWTGSSSGTAAFQGRNATPGTSGGYYALGTSPDFSLGALRSGGTGNITYTVSFTNNSGATITSITLSWDYEQYTFNNTSGWNCTGTGALSSNATLNAADFTGSSSGSSSTSNSTGSIVLTGLFIANGTNFGISWVTTDPVGSDNAVSIDNFSISASSSVNYFWNGANITASPAAGGTGTWATANAWRVNTNTGTQATWADNNNAILAGTGGAVTVGSSITTASTTISASGYSLVTSGSSNINFNGNIDLGTNSLTFAPISAASLTVGGVISNGSIVQNGAGTTSLTASNTFIGGVTISNGNLQLGNAGALNSTTPNALTMSGGTLSLNGNSITLSSISGSVGTVNNNNSTASTLTVNNSSNSSFGGVLANGATGSMAFTKTGSGTLILSGTNTYTGATTISAGTLNLTGSLTSAVTVSNGATLSGTGSTSGTCAVSGTISPAGSGSVGTISTNNFTLNNGSSYILDITDVGTNSTSSDRIASTGTFVINTTSTLNVSFSGNGITNFVSTNPYSWVIGTYTSGTPTIGTITINTSGITPSGVFAVTANSGNILLNYTPVTLTVSSNATAGTTVTQNSTNNHLYTLQIAAPSAGGGTITGIVFSGTYATTNTTNFKLYYSTSASFSTSTQLGANFSPVSNNGNISFTFSQAIAANNSGYFFLTTDVPCSAIINNSIQITGVSSITTTSARTGTPSAGTSYTIVTAQPNNASNVIATVNSGQVSLAWTAPTSCYSEIMIVVSPAANNGGTPSGDGSSYTANLSYTGGGTTFGNGIVVYKGNSSPQVITGLTNNTLYFFKVFTRYGTLWSDGVEISATPMVAPSIIYLHNFNDGATASPYNTNPTSTSGLPTGIFNSNLNTSSWVSSTNSFTNFGGSSGQSIVVQPGNGATSSITLTFNIANGYNCTITSFDFWRQRSSNGPTTISSITINGISVGPSTPITVPTSGTAVGITNVSNPVLNLTNTVTVVINLSAPSNTGQNFRLDDFTLYGFVTATSNATKLAITSITPTSPTAGSAFNVTVQSQDGSGNPVGVVGTTAFSLSTNGNAGAISGTTTGSIAAAANSVTVSGVILPTAGTGVTLTATRTSGDNLTNGVSSTFSVLSPATQLAFVNMPTSGVINTALTSFTVEARRPDNSVDNTFTGNITLNKASGNGNLTGTLSIAAVAGVATFNAVQFNTADTYTITASATNLSSVTSGDILINNASSSTDFFRSNSNSTGVGGEWSTASNWQSSVDGATNWITSTLVPSNSAAGITIRNGHNITISTGSITADDVTIEAGATFTISGGTFTLSNGIASTDFQVNGTFTRTGGNVSINSGAGIVFAANSLYTHAINGGTIPAANWRDSSNCNVTGMTNTQPNGLNQSFGNFTWNCSGQTTFVTINNSNFGTKNIFTLTSTNGRNFTIADNASVEFVNNFNSININGSNAIFVLAFSNTSNTISNVVNVTGNVTISAGRLQFSGFSGTPTLAENTVYHSILNVGGDLSISGTATILGSYFYGLVNFNGIGNPQSYSNSSSAGSSTNNYGVDYVISKNAIVSLNSDLNIYSEDNFSDGVEVAGTINVGVNFIKASSGTASYFYLAGNESINLNTSLISGRFTITTEASTTAIFKGMLVEGTGIPANTYVVDYTSNAGTNTIFLSNLVTATNSNATLTFSSSGNFITNSNAGITASSTTSGSIRLSATDRYFSSSANYEFRGQNTGNFASVTAPNANTVNNLIIRSSTTTSTSVNIIVNGSFLADASTFSIGTNTLTLNGSVSTTNSTATLPITSSNSGTVIYNQPSNGQNVLFGTYGNLTFSNFNKVLANTGSINISNIFTKGTATSHTITGSTINFNGGSQDIPGFVFNNLTISGSANKTAQGNIIVGNSGIGTLTLNTRQLVLNGNNLDINGPLNITSTGAISSDNLCIITIGGSGTIGSNLTFGTGKSMLGLIVNRPSQTITLGNNSSITIELELNLNAGTLNDGGNIITLQGDITGNATHTGSGNIRMTGTNGQISGATLGNLVIARSGTSSINLSGSPIINGTLSFDNATNEFRLFNYVSNTPQTLTISSTGSCIAGASNQIKGPGNLVLNGLFQTTNVNGFSGSANSSVQNTVTSVSIGSNSTVEYNANVEQNVTPRTDYQNVIISNTGTKKLTDATTINGALTIATTADYLALENQTLTLNGSIASGSAGYIRGKRNSSLIIGSSFTSGTLLMDQTTKLASSVSDLNEMTNLLKNFTINCNSGIITIGNDLAIASGFVKPDAGTLRLGDGNIHLKSVSINTTGQLGKVTGNIGYAGTGRFINERYFNSVRRGYRLIGPVGVVADGDLELNSIWQNWQEGATTAAYNPLPGFGTHITGNSGNGWNLGVNPVTGLDYTVSGNPSLWTYNTTNRPDAFERVTNTKQKRLFSFEGYYIIIRGDRSHNLNGLPGSTLITDRSNTILRSKGKAVVGDVLLSSNANPVYQTDGTAISSPFRLNKNNSLSANFGYSLVANPYACAIDWKKVYDNTFAAYPGNNLSNYYTVWMQTANANSGSWVSINRDDIINNGSGHSSNLNRFIQPGQGFFIKTINSDVQQGDVYLKFSEDDKFIDDESKLSSVFDANENPSVKNILRINLLKKGDTSFQISDGAVIVMKDEESNGLNGNDALKFENPLDNIAVRSNNRNIAIEYRRPYLPTDTIGIELWKLASGLPYQLHINAHAFETKYEALLWDRKNNSFQKINKLVDTYVDFQPTIDSSTYFKRFFIVFKEIQPLPVQLMSFTANKLNNNSGNQIQFSVSGEETVEGVTYTIEKSKEPNQAFQSIVTIKARNLPGIQQYSFMDADNEQTYYYRLQWNNHGNTQYSNIIKVVGNNPTQAFSVYPTLVKNHQFTIKMPVNYNKSLHYRVLTVDGKLVATGNIENTATHIVKLPSNLDNAGTHIVQLMLNNQVVFTQQIVISPSF
ncbi:MAG: beta strand repeat-containing protein [Chitinophagaceae bacterium]